jgi:hypothetical protein
MIDRILEVGSCFDWISPVYAMAQDLAHHGGHSLVMDCSGWAPTEIERVLRRAGIETWGLMADRAEVYLSCPKEQAARATYILQRAGIEILSGAVGGGQDKPLVMRGRSRLWDLLK